MISGTFDMRTQTEQGKIRDPSTPLRMTGLEFIANMRRSYGVGSGSVLRASTMAESTGP